MGGSSSTTTVTPTREQRRLVAATERLAKQQEGLIGESAALARSTAPQLTGLQQEEAALAPILNQLSAGDLSFAQNLIAPLQEVLSLDQANRILGGVRPSDEQRGFLSELAASQIAAGQSDIMAGLGDQLFSLREELAPSLGLRPSDTPITDRGIQAGRNALRQNAQLVNEARGREAAGLLDYPLQEFQTFGQQNANLQSLGQAATQFQQQLRQQALSNRAALQGQEVGQLAGLATGFKAPLGQAVGSLGATVTTTTNPGVLGLGNALGAGLYGAGQLGAFDNLFGGTGATVPAAGLGGPYGTGLY